MTSTSYLYFFLTDKQPNERQAFIKFGLTYRNISDRIVQYESEGISPVNIYYISTDKIKLRETIIKEFYEQADKYNDLPIWKHKGREFYKGDLVLLTNIFLYVSSLSIVDLENVRTRDLKEVMLLLKPINNYNIQYHSNSISYISDPIQDDISVLDSSNPNSSLIQSEIENAKYICTLCNKECKDKRGLAIHETNCKKVKPLLKKFECQYCNNEFASKQSLQIHLEKCRSYNNHLHSSSFETEKKKLEDQIEQLKLLNIEREINDKKIIENLTKENQVLKEKCINIENRCLRLEGLCEDFQNKIITLCKDNYELVKTIIK